MCVPESANLATVRHKYKIKISSCWENAKKNVLTPSSGSSSRKEEMRAGEL